MICGVGHRCGCVAGGARSARARSARARAAPPSRHAVAALQTSSLLLFNAPYPCCSPVAAAALQEINQSHGVMETAIFTEP